MAIGELPEVSPDLKEDIEKGVRILKAGGCVEVYLLGSVAEGRSRAALSTALQAFYQGIEGIFERIAKRIDGEVPSSPDWHRQLLNQMAEEGQHRPSVISTELANRLDPYLGFRHLARHTYPFFLNWSRMRGLVEELDAVLRSFQGEAMSWRKSCGRQCRRGAAGSSRRKSCRI